MKEFKIEQVLHRWESSVLVARYLDKIGVLNLDPLHPAIDATMLDEDQPVCFYKEYAMSRAVMIRSYNSRNLNPNSNIV